MSKRYGMKTGITGNNNRNKSEITTLNHTTMLISTTQRKQDAARQYY